MSVLYYLDSSVWVKRYFAEAGSSWVHMLFSREITLAGTALGYIEVAAALARRMRSGWSLPALQHQLMTEWNGMLQFEITSSVYEQALLLAWEQKLRGADAIHLAVAHQLRDQASRRSLDFVLVASDTELIRAAQELHLVVTNPAELT
jgi:predicted nucleic acid-binding protein